MCECSSIIPLVKCFPFASTMIAEPSVIFLPIAAIFPFFTNTSDSTKIPSFSLVQTVAFLNKIVSAVGFFKLPYATFGNVIGITALFFSIFEESITFTNGVVFTAVHFTSFPLKSTAFPDRF